MTRCSMLVLLAALVTGCAGSWGAVHFEGRSRPMVARADEVEARRVLPEGYRRIGTVSAACTLIEGRPELSGVRLADLDCSQARLERALREAAALAGGELLVGERCRSHPKRASGAPRPLDVKCSADVARSPAGVRLQPQREASADANSEDRPAASEAWAIRLDYTRAPDPPLAATPRRSELVGERAQMPPSHARLGDVVARCERGCSERGAYDALFAAAGRQGATDLIGVRCVQRGDGWLCTGTAAGFQVDPLIHAAAR